MPADPASSPTRRRSFPVLVALAALLAAPAGAAAQEPGAVTGRVADAETGGPLSDAMVSVEGREESAVLTSEEGRYRISGLPPGSYALLVQHIGYETVRTPGIRVRAGAATTADFSLTSRSFRLNPVVVTASRREEKSLDAPAHVSIVGREEIQQGTAITPTDHVEGLPGVDVARNGIQQANIVTRGFNNVFSGALLVMTDNRYARVPSLRFNAYNLIPTTNLDLERIEVVLGPGSALYGPNSANGVMHMVTMSPFESAGTTLMTSGGERSVFHGAFRHASVVSENVAFKVSGQYFTGDDFEFHDPVEVEAREEALDAGADPDTLRIGERDFDAQRFTTDVRLDVRMDDGSELIFSGGLNQMGSSIEMTGIGSAQADDWRYTYGQVRYIRDRLFAQVFGNFSDAGDTFLLRSGDPIVDESRMLAAQVQHGFDVGTGQSFTYGVDYQRTIPRTDGTITGRNEDDDTIDEIGGYLHSETSLSDRLTFVAAARLDDHSELEDPNFSPRAALVFQPAEHQNFRLTFNRAFDTPTTNNLFLDLRSATLPVPEPFDFVVRARGVPKSGYTFPRDCTGGIMGDLCMRSPLSGGQFVPANVAAIWDPLINALAPGLADFLPAPSNGAGMTLLRRLDPSPDAVSPFPVDREGPQDVDRIDATTRNDIEVGYKGLLGDRLLVQVDAYYSDIKDFVGPLKVETPSVFFSPVPLSAYINSQLAPLIDAGQISRAEVNELVSRLSQLPLGTVSPEESPSSDILLTYRNFGDVDLWGVDFAARLLVSDRFSFDGNVSWVSDECFDFNGDDLCLDAVDLALNAPELKWRLKGRFRDEVRGLTAEGQVRYTDGFPMNSGVFQGEVDSYTVVDANVSYRIPGIEGTTVSLTAQNLFDNEHKEFVGAPALGRVLLARLRYDF